MPHSEDHSTDRPGQRLKRARQRLKLTYRDVEQASIKVAARRGSSEFAIGLSRLADIENKGTLPSLYRAYTLAAIYRLDMDEILRWYGIPRDALTADALQLGFDQTHAARIETRLPAHAPAAAELQVDPRRTTFLSGLVRQWGKLPLQLIHGVDLRKHRYGLIGQEDWSMYPVLHPGALVLIDERRRKVVRGGWTNEYDRPIYFLENRSGFACGWCDVDDGRLILQPHPASHQKPKVFEYPAEIDVIGQVTGVAMNLVGRNPRSLRAATIPPMSPSP